MLYFLGALACIIHHGVQNFKGSHFDLPLCSKLIRIPTMTGLDGSFTYSQRRDWKSTSSMATMLPPPQDLLPSGFKFARSFWLTKVSSWSRLFLGFFLRFLGSQLAFVAPLEVVGNYQLVLCLVLMWVGLQGSSSPVHGRPRLGRSRPIVNEPALGDGPQDRQRCRGRHPAYQPDPAPSGAGQHDVNRRSARQRREAACRSDTRRYSSACHSKCDRSLLIVWVWGRQFADETFCRFEGKEKSGQVLGCTFPSFQMTWLFLLTLFAHALLHFMCSRNFAACMHGRSAAAALDQSH